MNADRVTGLSGTSLEPLTNEDRRAMDALAADVAKALPWGAEVVQAPDGFWNAQTRTYGLHGGHRTWRVRAGHNEYYGDFDSRAAALAALAKAPAPPDWVDINATMYPPPVVTGQGDYAKAWPDPGRVVDLISEVHNYAKLVSERLTALGDRVDILSKTVNVLSDRISTLADRVRLLENGGEE